MALPVGYSLYSDNVYDQYGRPIPDVDVYVYIQQTGGLAALVDPSGAAIANPTATNIDGLFTFGAPDGLYVIRFVRNGQPRFQDKAVQIGPVAPLPDSVLLALADPGGASLVGSTGSSNVQTDLDARPTAAELLSDTGASAIGTLGGATVQDLLKYVRSFPFALNLGYDDISGTAALVRVGGNTAFNGASGAFQVGGAGPRDGGNGAYIVNDGHPNWNTVQSSIPFNPTEWNIYGNGNGGIAVSTGTTTLTRSTGRAWTADMVGLTLWFDGLAYTINSFVSSSSVVLNAAPPAGTAAWIFVYTTGAGSCTVASGVVTRVTGDPFIPNTFGSGFTFKLGTTAYTVTANGGGDSCTIASPPADGAYTYSYRTNINNQVTTLRLQLLAGASEENLSHYAAPYGYVSGAQQAGSGKLRDWNLTSEYQAVVGLPAYGKFVSLGGPQNNEALRALWSASAVNRVEVSGGATGIGSSLRSRGQDTNVDLGFDTKGTGKVRFTSGAFGAVEFEVLSGGGTSWLAVASNSSAAPTLSANGAAADIDIKLAAKGAGRIWTGPWTSNVDAAVNGYITVKDSSGNLRKLATIA